MRNDVNYIEFVGLPGTGKTTVAHRVGQLLTIRHHSVFSRDDLIDHRSRFTRMERGLSLSIFLFMNLGLVMNIMNFGLLFRPINFFSLKYAYGCVRTIFKIRTAIRVAGQAGNDTVIFDQGILQDIWSIGVTGDPTKNIKLCDHIFKLLKRIFKIGKFSTVLLEVPIEQAVDRILARDPTPYRFDNMDRVTLLDTLNKKSDYMQLIAQTAGRLNEIRQLAIDTSRASVQASALRVISFIKNETGHVANLYSE